MERLQPMETFEGVRFVVGIGSSSLGQEVEIQIRQIEIENVANNNVPEDIRNFRE